MKKKLLGLTLATALMLGAFSAVYAGTVNAQAAENEQPKAVKAAYGENANFSDLKSTNWAYEAVNAMSKKGIVKGYSDGTFKPNNTVTYAEFIKMALIAATGEDVGNADAVNEETGAKQHWALNYYNKALELGYFGQTDIKALQLGNEIPRSDMALIVSNILGDVKIENYSDLEAKLSDFNSKTENDYDIIKAYASGIITGYQDGTFKPEGTLTRAESSTVIYRILEESARVLPNVSETALEDVTTDIEGNPIDNETDPMIAAGFKKMTLKCGLNFAYEQEIYYKEARLADLGIVKIEKQSNGYYYIYSTKIYDDLVLVVDGYKFQGVANVDGTNYFTMNNYYTYVVKKNNIDTAGKRPMIIIETPDSYNGYLSTDMTL